MQEEETRDDNGEQARASETPVRSARLLEQRMEKRRHKTSTGKLISYIIALIAVLLFMYLLKRQGL